MNLQDLIKMSAGLVPAEVAITVGTSNRIIVSKGMALEKLKYQDEDEFFIDKLVDSESGITGIVIGCVPKNIDIIKTFPFNTTGLTFSNKIVADYLGGEKSQWNISTKFGDLELDNRVCPMYIIEQVAKGEEVTKKQNELYNKFQTNADLEESFNTEGKVSETNVTAELFNKKLVVKPDSTEDIIDEILDTKPAINPFI